MLKNQRKADGDVGFQTLRQEWSAWVCVAIRALAVQAVFCLLIALIYDFSEPPPFAKYGIYFLTGVAFIGCGKMIKHLFDRPEHPIAHLLAQDWSKFQALVVAVVLLWLQWVLLTWAKAMLPLPAGMWADIPLADFERAILGADAWTFLPPSGALMTAIYQFWAPTVILGFCWRAYVFDANRSRSLLAILLTIGILGTIGQYLLPSGGPIFFERLGFGDRFEAIDYHPVIVRVGDYLWDAYSGNYLVFASGISAFPSIHVATSVWLALAIGRWWACIYPAFIFFGSIMTGFHYAIDGVASIIGAILIFRMSGFLVTQNGKARN